MQEPLISFETAKLAREKGFNEMCFKQYDKEGSLSRISREIDVAIDPYEYLMYARKKHYPTLTQSLLQKWLRDKHCIHVKMIWVDTLSDIYVYHISTTNNAIRPDSIFYHSYEEALEMGLQEALKLI